MNAIGKKHSGLTMIEIMVAMTISLILLAGVGQIYMSSKQNSRTTDAMSRLQENGRFAMNFIVQSIRDTDHWGCLGRFNHVADPGNVISADIDGDGNDETVNNFSAGLSSMNDVSVTGLVNSDTIRLISASQDGMSVNSAAGNSFTISVDSVDVDGDGTADFVSGDDILINDCEKAQITTITGISGTAPTITITIANALNQSYFTDATVHRIITTTYSLGVNADGNPALFLDNGTANLELVEGVENMQVLYGEDTDGDRVANYYVAPGTIVDMNNVVSARLTLTVRTLDDNIAQQNRTYNGVSDNRFSKNYIATISIRNRLN